MTTAMRLNTQQVLISLLVIASLLVATPSMARTPMVALPDFSVLAEQNSPVVVNISTKKKVKQQRIPEQFRGIPDEMLRYFFGIPRGGENPGGQRPRNQVSSLGSGFIISDDGYIITNNHVIAEADDIVVKLSNRKELKAKVIGTDPRTDIAVLKIEAEGLPVAKIGTSKDLKVGQWVLAIGEPFGLDYTVTHGIVSALGRSLPDDTYVPFIQTDVAINPGNSGGPLFNMKGEVVGVNAQIFSSSGGSMGLSFSIPIDIAMNVSKQLIEKGQVTRGFLGVSVQEVYSDLAHSFGMKHPKGALVAEIVKNSSAEEAGLKPGDVILEFNGEAIEKSADLPPIVGASEVGKPLEAKILRNGKTKTLKVTLKPLNGAVASSGTGARNIILGVQLEELNPKLLEKLNLPFGLGITDVEPGSAAQKAGIMPGDILVTVNFQPIKSVEALNEVMKRVPKNRSVPVRVVRGNRSIFLPLNLSK